MEGGTTATFTIDAVATPPPMGSSTVAGVEAEFDNPGGQMYFAAVIRRRQMMLTG